MLHFGKQVGTSFPTTKTTNLTRITFSLNIKESLSIQTGEYKLKTVIENKL